MADQQKYTADTNARIISLIYGYLTAKQSRFWVYMAVIPGKYKELIAAQKNNTLDFMKLEPYYGEILAYGHGDNPPPEVTAKVAEVYKMDASTFFQPIDLEEDVKKKLNKLNSENP